RISSTRATSWPTVWSRPSHRKGSSSSRTSAIRCRHKNSARFASCCGRSKTRRRSCDEGRCLFIVGDRSRLGGGFACGRRCIENFRGAADGHHLAGERKTCVACDRGQRGRGG